jgi:hypothetical protein
MTPTEIRNSIFLVCCLFVLSGVANAQVVRCIDETGAVTFTDTPCKSDGDAARGSRSTKVAELQSSVTPIAPAVKNFAAAEGIRAAAWTAGHQTGPALAIDVATLKAAKALMISTSRAPPFERRRAS